MNHFDHFLSAQFGSIKFLTLLYSHYHHLFPELYSPCKAETLSALIPQCLPPNLHQPILRSLSMSLSILGTSNKWNHTILELSFLAWASQVAQWVKNLPAIQQDTRETGSIPGLGRSPGGGHGNPFQYSDLLNPREEPGGLRSIGLQTVEHS